MERLQQLLTELGRRRVFRALLGWGIFAFAVTIVAHSSAGPTYTDRFKSDGTFEPLPDFDPEQLSPDMPHAVAFSLLDENHIAWWVDVWVAAPTIQPSSNLATTTNVRTTD